MHRFRTIGEQPTLWDAVLPAKLLALPEGAGRMDALPDDPAFFAPLAPYFDSTTQGRQFPMSGVPKSTTSDHKCLSLPDSRFEGRIRLRLRPDGVSERTGYRDAVRWERGSWLAI